MAARANHGVAGCYSWVLEILMYVKYIPVSVFRAPCASSRSLIDERLSVIEDLKSIFKRNAYNSIASTMRA